MPQDVELHLWNTVQVDFSPEVNCVVVGVLVSDLVFISRQVEAYDAALASLDLDTVDLFGRAVFNVVAKRLVISCDPDH